ncbi:hypothetical protein [Alteromonas sp. a30]|uniref:hypothetical protein n=1 Tax=Alteromonas sp. a30 TaxID=2730917 RepID=UPI00227F90E0|nr:hypothetical protein [Alteromonas sp. a30]MCY7296928.1 hypothetical protein [Alteromonas sp. a30]
MNLGDFYQLSAILTGYDEARLQGSGVGETYYEVLTTLIPSHILTQLQDTFCTIEALPKKALDSELRKQILANAMLGPVARNILKMWYTSIWYPMPTAWSKIYAVPNQSEQKYQDVEFIISDDAYIQGLAWEAVHSHPMGAKQPGYATWSFTPHDIASATAKRNPAK